MTESLNNSKIPVVGVTMGDAAGIGPEVIVKALCELQINTQLRPFVIGDAKVLERTVKDLGVQCDVTPYSAGISLKPNSIEVFDLRNLETPFEVGIASAETGKAAGEYIEKAVQLWRKDAIDAICTAPINKNALNLGGYDFPGHTEFFAALAKTEQFAMSFFSGELRVVLLSTHLPLVDALHLVKQRAVVDLIKFADEQLSKLLARRISIAVAGLNPHASENGKFGNEEKEEIEPAIAVCRSEAINVDGPFSPDTVFLRGHNGEFDAVIALYHDQATIPVKALSFGSAVNVTLGLPFIRTSVDHGTAFDIAGKGIADPSSMKAAIMLAADLALAGTVNR